MQIKEEKPSFSVGEMQRKICEGGVVVPKHKKCPIFYSTSTVKIITCASLIALSIITNENKLYV